MLESSRRHAPDSMIDPIPNDELRELLQFDLKGGKGQWIVDGEEGFSQDQKGIARIVMAGGHNTANLTNQLRLDSTVKLLLPTIDLDSETTYQLSVTFFIGDRPVILLDASDPLPRDLILFITEQTLGVLRKVDLSRTAYLELAWDVKNMGLWMLELRIRTIEQSVRDALKDEELTNSDYKALRSYPTRLAIVEASHGRSRRTSPNGSHTSGRLASRLFHRENPTSSINL